MHTMFKATTVIGALLLTGCDKGQGNNAPASPSQTAAPAPAAPMAAHSESNLPATAPINGTSAGTATTMP